MNVNDVLSYGFDLCVVFVVFVVLIDVVVEANSEAHSNCAVQCIHFLPAFYAHIFVGFLTMHVRAVSVHDVRITAKRNNDNVYFRERKYQPGTTRVL